MVPAVPTTCPGGQSDSGTASEESKRRFASTVVSHRGWQTVVLMVALAAVIAAIVWERCLLIWNRCFTFFQSKHSTTKWDRKVFFDFQFIVFGSLRFLSFFLQEFCSSFGHSCLRWGAGAGNHWQQAGESHWMSLSQMNLSQGKLPSSGSSKTHVHQFWWKLGHVTRRTKSTKWP